MKKYLYAYFNKITNFFAPVQTSDIRPGDYPDYFKEAVVACDPKYLEAFLEDDLYYLGTYDNITGEIIPVKEFVLHCGELASQVLSKIKVGSEDDNKSVPNS